MASTQTPAPAAPAAAAPAAAAAAAAVAAAVPAAPPRRVVEGWAWACSDCGGRECVPIRSESRCLCGHRLREHAGGTSCSKAGCTCTCFAFIVAEGAWVLRCRCKHKHTDHDPASHACRKAGCACAAFDSPWVCNCDHPWARHTQQRVQRQVLSAGDMLQQQQQQQASDTAAGSSCASTAPQPPGVVTGGVAAVLAESDLTCEVNRWDMVQRGKAA